MPPRFTRDFQRTLLRIPGIAVLHFAYGTFTLYGRCIPPSFGYAVRADPGPSTPHFRSLSGRIRFAVFRVRSPLLAESRLISFPPLTKMLQFGGCPLVTEFQASEGLEGSPIRLSRFQRLLAATPGISRLGATFVGS